MITPGLKRIRDEVYQRYSVSFATGVLKDLGVYNRRNIAGTNTWSQHAWGNAFDIGGNVAVLDQVYVWLRNVRSAGSLPVGTILWRVKDHYDHIHVEAIPKQKGTPPKGIDIMAAFTVKQLQEALIEAGFTDYQNKPLTPDDEYGPRTKSAFVKALNYGAVLDPAPVIASAAKAAIDELRKRLAT
jgi:hypothetical protein